MNDGFYIFGAGGLGQEVLNLLQDIDCNILGFIDDFYTDEPYEGYEVYRSIDKEIVDHCKDNGNIVIAVGSPKIREKTFFKFKEMGAYFPSIVHPRAYVGYGCKLEEGVIITPGVTITTNVTIGKGTYVNINSTIGHKTKIGSFCHIAPGSNISGDCVINDRVYIGTGSKIIEKIFIGEDVVVGAGAVVLEFVRSNILVAGVPAIIKKELPR